MKAPLRAPRNINCSAQKIQPASKSFTVFSFSLYIKASTVITADMTQKVCQSM